jgi:hypothetical protein
MIRKAVMGAAMLAAACACAVSAEPPEGIGISGTIEGQLRCMRCRTILPANGGVATDLYLRMVELGIEADVADWATGTVVLNSEWIGDCMMAGDGGVEVDEAHIDIRKDPFPLYCIVGKRTLPFGIFENDLVSDPMTQDAYETERVGATFGCITAFGTDLSVTAYKGGERIDHLFASGLFDTTIIARRRFDICNVNSVVVSASTAPLHDSLTMFAAVSSEPGADRRNVSVDGGFSVKMPFLPNLGVDVEYMRALRRETYGAAAREFRESVLAASVSYSFIPIGGGIAGRGNYKARRAFRRTQPILVSARYERFDDDSMRDETHIWSVRDRYLVGGRYTVLGTERFGLSRGRIPKNEHPSGARLGDARVQRRGVSQRGDRFLTARTGPA